MIIHHCPKNLFEAYHTGMLSRNPWKGDTAPPTAIYCNVEPPVATVRPTADSEFMLNFDGSTLWQQCHYWQLCMKSNLNDDDNDNAISHFHQNTHRVSKKSTFLFFSLDIL